MFCLLASVPGYLAAIPCVSRTVSVVVSIALGGALLLWLIRHLPVPHRFAKGTIAVVAALAAAAFSSNLLLGGIVDLQQVYQNSTTQKALVEETAPESTLSPEEQEYR